MRNLLGSIATILFSAGYLHAADKDRKLESALAERIAVVDKLIDAEAKSLVDLYKDLHKNPELSLMEERSSAKMAAELQKLGFEVTPKFAGFGLVGIFKNGNGPTILVRTDMDGLPVVEATGLPYASKVTARDRYGKEVGVMHACGHDMHMACWVGTARTLIAMKDKWAGTLMFIAQPAEEIGMGAKMMLEAGLFKKFQKPDYCLALHCDFRIEAGHINFTEGVAMANVDTIEILVKGKGGHGAAPHTTIDPVVLSAKIILDLQTIVSRERNPTEPSVVTVGSIHGGTKSNIIPNDVKLQLTVRTTNDVMRKNVKESIERICKAAAVGFRAPEPEFTYFPNEFTPRLLNESKLTRKTTALFRDVLGEDKVHEVPMLMGGEDFSRYANGGEIPIFLYFLGTADAERFNESLREGGKPLPSMHSDGYYPTPDKTLRFGVKTMSLAVLNLVGK
jgi:hippurate hydrolase